MRFWKGLKEYSFRPFLFLMLSFDILVLETKNQIYMILYLGLVSLRKHGLSN
ncbi:hypothetical protein LEP1GSC112_2972 [Leptospira interrogans serovar Pomona str. UT364]|nr:hypothetical protein LEP1GSC112_2972 [Leptospira interrogans serovar Pomona str. UT364]